MTLVKHILVAVDLSEMTPLVMTYARQLAEVWKARLTVLHVVHDLSYYAGAFITSKPLKTLQQDLETEASERLGAWCEEVYGSEVAYETVVLEGRPIAEIPRMIREFEVDCLVIGAHSMDKPEHLLFGSTAERLLHHIQCPTVVIPMQRVDYVSNA
jgi:nucleotide-binding universal stress UspA family protein